MAALALLCGILFLFVEGRTENRLSIYDFNMGENAFVSLLTGAFGSGAVIFVSMLLPENIRLLSEIGRRSMHIMVFHRYPMPIHSIVLFCWEAAGGPAINVGITAGTFLVSYVCARYVFEPFCRRTKAQFDAIVG